MKSSNAANSEPTPAGCARMGPLCAIPAVLGDLGLDPANLIAELGIPPDYFDSPDRIVSYPDGGRILAACAAKTGCEHFGLLVGQRCSLAGLGIAGQAAAAATDVGEALWTITRYLPLFDRGAVLSLRIADQDAAFVFGILTAGMAGADQLYDLAITIAINTLRDLCGSCWRPSRVTLPHKAPKDVQPFRTYYMADVRFDAEDAAIAFDRVFLARPLSASTAAERLRLLERAAAIEAMLDVTMAERVRRQLRGRLPTRWLSEGQVAAQLMTSARTLRLRLINEGTSFRDIVDDLRFETARQFLATSKLELNDIALLLGYGDYTAFSRAFRRWSGTAPSGWRAAQENQRPGLQ